MQSINHEGKDLVVAMSYIDSSRGNGARGWRKNVPNCRPSHRLWCICVRSVWLDLLDNHVVLTGVHRTPLRNLSNNTVGANCVRPKNGHLYGVRFNIGLKCRISTFAIEARPRSLGCVLSTVPSSLAYFISAGPSIKNTLQSPEATASS